VTLLLKRLKRIDDLSNDQDANQLIMVGQLFQNKIKGQVKKYQELINKNHIYTPTYTYHSSFHSI